MKVFIPNLPAVVYITVFRLVAITLIKQSGACKIVMINELPAFIGLG